MVNTIRLGGTASNVVVSKVAHGLMMMTWRPVPVPDEEAFEAIKSGVDSLPEGVKMVLNSAEFYGNGFSTANLELLARFYEKYPEYADKTFLSVKVRPSHTTRTPALKPPKGGWDKDAGHINCS
ncbi:Pyridoxal reductase [Grifola frondosa]|uniref:Pyridoxal reductase n=1 Tax=Grifola frondosa TaxID=5627 RepID=A0A1C7M4H4_GRIFR|nr:Pyridoxal reductase [Grifola frondosa]